jgi:U3 small nucleolar RNA-associated protein 21
LKIWDVLSGVLVEWIEFKKTPMSISISNNNQFIATSFVGCNGIYLWLNRTQFVDMVQSQSVKSAIKMNLPYASRIKKQKSRKDLYNETIEMDVTETKNTQKKMKIDITDFNSDSKLLTLSGENQIKYRIIQNLEIIQERNDPKIKKKEKTKAPFFLFNINDLKINSKEAEKKESNELLSILENYSHFSSKNSDKKIKKLKNEFILKELLQNYSDKKLGSNEINKILNLLNPFLIDLEIRNLDPILNNKSDLLLSFLNYIYDSLNEKWNFELVNSYLNRFLKIYPNYCFSDERLSEVLMKINIKIEEYTNDLEYLFNNTLSLVSHFGQIQI